MSLTDELMNYLERVERKAASPDYVPHPMLKALMLANKGAEDGKKDGNYVGVSDDADLTPNKQPHISIAVVVKKEGQIITVLEIRDLSVRKVIPFDIDRKIVASETLLERFDKQEVPNEAAERIINETTGMKVHILEKEDEILQALLYAKKAVREGKAQGLSPEWSEEILRVNSIAEWRAASQQARSMVGGLWAFETKRNMVITTLESTVPKWKLRETILRSLQETSPV